VGAPSLALERSGGMPWTLLALCQSAQCCLGSREDLVSPLRPSLGTSGRGRSPRNLRCPSRGRVLASTGIALCEVEKTVVPPSVRERSDGIGWQEFKN